MSEYSDTGVSVMMYKSLWCFVVVLGMSVTEGFTPSASAGGVGTGGNGNLVDRTWDPVEPSGVASYYPGPRPWSPAAPAGPLLPHNPTNFGVSLPPITAPTCWSTPSLAGAALISILALAAILATKLPLILLAPAVLALLALPLALPLLAPVIALAFMLPMPMDDSSMTDDGTMAMTIKPIDDKDKPTDTSDSSKPSSRQWHGMNFDGQQCLQKVACQLGRHAGDTGMWMVKKLPESEWGIFREAYLEGSRSNNQSENACVKFKCSAKGALEAFTAATMLQGTL